jgi:chromosomal replication initiation ATPase DnaA
MMTAEVEHAEMVRINVRRAPSTPRLEHLRYSIHEVVHELTGVTMSEILGPYYDRRVVQARWLLTWGLKHVLGMTNAGVGRHLKRDNTSVRYGCREALRRWPGLCQEIRRRCE